MSSAGNYAKKRKADEISDEESVDVPHLPAPVWGGILDFMPYGEVRSALLVGKHIGVEAVKYVKALNVIKASEMFVPATRRFPNVEMVNIFCLLQGTGKFDDPDGDGLDGDGEFYTLSSETAYSTAPFLAGFPRLKEAFIGGMLKWTLGGIAYERHYNDFCDGPEDHEEIFRGLVASLGGAFKTGLLSPEVTIIGLNDYNWNLVRPCHRSRAESDAVPCSWCRNVCKQFPLPHILQKSFVTSNYCLKMREFWEIIDGRPGGKQAIMRANDEAFCSIIFRSLRLQRFGAVELEEFPPELSKRMQDDSLDFINMWSIPESGFSKIDEMINASLDPKRIREDFLLAQFKEHVRPAIDIDIHELDLWLKSTVTSLSSRGFPVDWIIPIDDKYVP